MWSVSSVEFWNKYLHKVIRIIGNSGDLTGFNDLGLLSWVTSCTILSYNYTRITAAPLDLSFQDTCKNFQLNVTYDSTSSWNRCPHFYTAQPKFNSLMRDIIVFDIVYIKKKNRWIIG